LHPTAYQVLLPNTTNSFSLPLSPIFAPDHFYEPLIAESEQQLHHVPSPFAEYEQQLLATVVTDIFTRPFAYNRYRLSAEYERQLRATAITDIAPTACQVFLPNTNNSFSLPPSRIFAPTACQVPLPNTNDSFSLP
jgi:hypothetical protein